MKELLLAALTLTAAAPLATKTPAATVVIQGFAYVPATLTVAPGQSVRFVNRDSEAHTVTATDRAFDSGGLDTGDSWTRRFDRPGTYRYFCELHPYMKGVVIVRARGGSR